MVRTHPRLELTRVKASLITDNIGLSAHAASTIGSLTCRYFSGWKRCNRSIRRKKTEEETLRRKHRRRWVIRVERRWKEKKIQGIEKRKEMNSRKGK